MASPYIDGTFTSSPISSKNIDVFSECIKVTVNPYFESASYNITYTINTTENTNFLPLIFVVADTNSEFKVFIDDTINVKILDFNSIAEDEMFKLGFNIEDEGNNRIKVKWSLKDSCSYNKNCLKFFKLNLVKGIHKINVSYKAKPSGEKKLFYNELYFQYNLQPAKYWKSFKNLTVEIVNLSNSKCTFNLSALNNVINANDKAIFVYDKLPFQNSFNINEIVSFGVFTSFF